MTERARRAAPVTLLVTALAVVVAFLAVPVVALFCEVPLARVPALIGGRQVREALWVTARTVAIADGAMLLFCTPAAYLLATRRFPGRGALITVLELPLVLPPAVAGVALLSAFGRGGLFGDALQDAGIVLPFTEWAVVLAILFVSSPFYVRAAIAAFETLDPVYREAARSLGAGPWATFRLVTAPLAASGLTAGWVLAFARGIGEFGATIIFAGSVRGQTQTLTLAIYDLIESDFDAALAMGILLVVTSAVVLVAYKLVAWRRTRPVAARR
ncbi:MAG TPA: ABC transporter permease [Solirubrobacteraceae bacterium]|nr:ABC transporter permease [Solirubrobacteraceae bacterium]